MTEHLDMDEGYAQRLYELTGECGGMVFRPFREPRRVKNLGWLLRHGRFVRHFYVYHTQAHACGFEPSYLDWPNTPTCAAMRAAILSHKAVAS